MAGQRRAQSLHPLETRYLEALGARIRALRQERHLGLEELADRSGLHRTHLWKIEKGLLNAGVISYVRLAQQLDLPLGDLLPPHETLDSTSE